MTPSTSTAPTAQSTSGGVDANPEALNAIIKAGETYSIVASQDIVDVRGLKLLAKGQQVSAALQQRLLERKLLQPLESCLVAEDGVTPFKVHDALKEFLDGSDNVAMALRPWAPDLLEQARHCTLHSVAQLLLTTALANRSNTFSHAVQAMALAGAMACRSGTKADTRLAMLGGLLHDIGEVYIQPRYLAYSGPMDLVGYKHLVVHPRAAQLLLRTSTDYPEALSLAVGEHHERMDGSGYPARLTGANISTLGRMLAVVEVTLGILRSPVAPLTRASFALRVVPGEFDTQWIGLVCDMARDANESFTWDGAPAAVFGTPPEEIAMHSQTAQALEDSFKAQGRTGAILEIPALAQQRLAQLLVAWNALGLWGVQGADLSPQERFDAQLASRELQQHLRDLQRECMLLSEKLGVSEKLLLAPLWRGLLS